MKDQASAPVRSIGVRQASARKSAKPANNFGSNIFPTLPLAFKSGPPETVVIGGREKFPLIGTAFDAAGIKQVTIFGYGSQGPAQSQNLRDTLATIGRTDIKVSVGLRGGSGKIALAQSHGWNGADGTLGDMYELAGKSDLILCLIADGGLVKTYPDILKAAKPGAIIGLSHGFLPAFLESQHVGLAPQHDHIMVAPKGMGGSLRKLYLQGLTTEGAGINSSIAVQPRSAARYNLVQDVANALSVGIGSPVTFGTDMVSELISDLTGERAILLGGLWGQAEAMLEYYLGRGMTNEQAFESAVSGLTGTVTNALSEHGISGFYKSLSPDLAKAFEEGYAIGYEAYDNVIDQIYHSVSSLEEVRDVIDATEHLSDRPMVNIEQDTPMWQYARDKGLYGQNPALTTDIAFNAGIYVGGAMSQMQTLLGHGHNVSEICNETDIEAWDSLTPYMHKNGVAFMVDGCSTTARLGTRKWGPLFRNGIAQALRNERPSGEIIAERLRTLDDADLHHDLGICMAHRPSVRITF